MGTNYYFMTKNKRLAHKYFAVDKEYYTSDEEYEIVEDPFLGYQIHLNKCSYGWRTLFQKHKAFQTFNDLKDFYNEHKKSLRIFDEYGEEYTWEQYEHKVISHSENREQEPCKWCLIGGTYGNHLELESCSEDEADIYTPFIHEEYERSHREAQKKFGVFDYSDAHMDYSMDPDYPVDWVSGDFC